MKLYRAEMGGLEPRLWLNEGNLEASRRSWTQNTEHWTLFFLQHTGGFSVNNRTYLYEDGHIGLVAPGTRAGFVRTGEGTPHLCFTFALKKSNLVVALPALAPLGEWKAVRRKEAYASLDWIPLSIGRGLAFVHNVLWEIALPPDSIRDSTVVHEFETLVVSRLREKLSVAVLAAEVGISQSQLLRLVRAEYGTTAQEFIRDKRAEVARSLIVSTDVPFKEVAAQTGMPDLQYLNKTIRAASGLSPRALRALAKTTL